LNYFYLIKLQFSLLQWFFLSTSHELCTWFKYFWSYNFKKSIIFVFFIIFFSVTSHIILNSFFSFSVFLFFYFGWAVWVDTDACRERERERVKRVYVSEKQSISPFLVWNIPPSVYCIIWCITFMYIKNIYKILIYNNKNNSIIYYSI
jgi:hypothetical protein